MPMICDCCCAPTICMYCLFCYKNVCFSSCFSIITHASNLWQSPGGCRYWIILLFFVFPTFFMFLSRHTRTHSNQMQMFIVPSVALCPLCVCSFPTPLQLYFPICHSPLPPFAFHFPIHNQVARNLHKQRLQKFWSRFIKITQHFVSFECWGKAY